MRKNLLTFLYEGRFADTGEVFDKDDKVGCTVAPGRGQVFPLIEEALEEMEPGEVRTIELAAKDAYGEHLDKAVQKVFIQDIPNGKDLPVGEYISWKNPVSQKPIPVKVLSVRNGIAMFDMNHPLAGRDLVYKVKLVS